MKGNATCHTTNKEFRDGYDRTFKKEATKKPPSSEKVSPQWEPGEHLEQITIPKAT